MENLGVKRVDILLLLVSYNRSRFTLPPIYYESYHGLVYELNSMMKGPRVKEVTFYPDYTYETS